MYSRNLTKEEKHDDDLFNYEVDRGRIYSRIYVSSPGNSIHYELREPFLNEILEKVIGDLRKKVTQRVSDRPEMLKQGETVDPIIKEVLRSSTLEQNGKRLAYYYLNRDFEGYGRITGLLMDPGIEDISCDGSEVPVFVYHSSYGFIPTNVQFSSEGELNSFIRNMVQKTGKNISISTPIVDSTLPDGSRLQASIGKYVTTNGPSFTIRKFRKIPLSPVDLIMNGTGNAELFAYLWILTEYGANIIITGGTATGKTTFLNSILLFAPPDKKILSIEDTREINLFHENWLPTVTRSGFGKGGEASTYGEVDMFDLLVSSLRHRPDYVVLGEVRGRETFTVFQAMSVGRYSYCTFHAENIETLIHRLDSRPISIPRNLITSLDAVVVLSALQEVGKTRRVVSSISEINGMDQKTSEIIINRLYSLDASNTQYETSMFSYALERIATRTGQPLAALEEELRTRSEFLQTLVDRRITRFDAVASIIDRYHRNRDSVLAEFSIQ